MTTATVVGWVLFYLVGCALSMGLFMDARYRWSQDLSWGKIDTGFCALASLFSWIGVPVALVTGARG